MWSISSPFCTVMSGGGVPGAISWSPWSRRCGSLAFVVAFSLAMLPVTNVRGEELKTLSFYPPFNTFNAKGDRMVPSWSSMEGGQVKQSFARLTRDQVSNNGLMYSRLTGRFNTGPPGGQFSLAMSFRMSGSNEKHHGKHLAVVLGSPDQIRRVGPTFGFGEKFVGVGISITSRPPADLSEPVIDGNPRGTGPRQYVSVFSNNGTRSTEDVRILASSCASTLRYLESRDDFNFLRSSRVRMGYYDGEVVLEVDSRNTGVWRKCVSTKIFDMPDDWLNRIGVAITGGTGLEVSNHHDVMSLEVYSTRDEAFDKSVVDGATVDEDGGVGDEEAKDAARVERLAAIRAHMEHEFDSVERILKDSMSKLGDKHDSIYSRLEKLEKELNTEALSFLNDRVKSMEERVKSNAETTLEHRLKNVERDFHDEMGSSMEAMVGNSGGWRVPFFLVVMVVMVMMVYTYGEYRRVMKSNFLGGMR